MANLSCFTMKVRGHEKDVEKFFQAMSQEGDIWMGRGANVDAPDVTELPDGRIIASANGDCNWSIQSALIDNAVSMRRQKETGIGYWHGLEAGDVREFITLFEAAEKYSVDFEVYSKEPGCGFQEHFYLIDGRMCNDSVPYTEVYLENYESRETAEEYLGESVSEEEWEKGYKCSGGYGEWSFIFDRETEAIETDGKETKACLYLVKKLHFPVDGHLNFIVQTWRTEDGVNYASFGEAKYFDTEEEALAWKMKKEEKEEAKACPLCFKVYAGHPAISRRRDEYICPVCGLKEALEDGLLFARDKEVAYED